MDKETVKGIIELMNAGYRSMIESTFDDGVDIDDIIHLAETGNAEAQALIGAAHLYGVKVRQNYDKAVKWLEKSARQGCAVAENQLGVCYAAGMGVEQDIDEAIRWVRRSVKHGFTEGTDFLKVLESVYD